MKRDFIGAAPNRDQFIAQPKLHRQQQFNAARARAHHRDRRFARMGFHALKQREPAFIELADRFHCDGVLGRTRHRFQLRRGADVD